MHFTTSRSPELLASRFRPRSGKWAVLLLLAALAGMFAVVSMLVFTAPLTRNQLGLLGGLRVTADRGTVVFVGDRLVGTPPVDVSWNELLGAAGRPPLAVAIDPGVEEPDFAVLGGEEAEVVWNKAGATGAFRGTHDANFAFHAVVLRRANATLDHLFVIDCEFPDATGRWQRLLVPIRARAAEPSDADYFPTAGFQGGGNVSRGMIPSRRDQATFELKLQVQPGAVPAQLAEQGAELEWWRPADAVAP